jgi:hypothetical protein
MARWPADTEHARENWRGAFSKDSPHDHRKAHDLIEAWRLAWSLRALFAPGRPEPAFDKSFVTDQLMGEDYQEPDSGLRMPLGTGSLFLAARLQQISPGELHFLGNQSPGVDLEYVGDPVRQHGRVFIEHKERAYLKSRSRTKEDPSWQSLGAGSTTAPGGWLKRLAAIHGGPSQPVEMRRQVSEPAEIDGSADRHRTPIDDLRRQIRDEAAQVGGLAPSRVVKDLG